MSTFERNISRTNQIQVFCLTNQDRLFPEKFNCGLIDPDLDLAVALKLRPHGGVIGVDDSRLDYFLGISKVFRLHAILHDASGFVKDYTDKGPGYVYAVDICNINNCLFGHLSGLGFCLYIKYFKSDLFRTLEC